VGDNFGFLVDLPNRQSFSPDAAWVHASRIFRQGELADAEPAVPGWRFAVDDLFP
jgi:hypothetical protein